VPGFMTDILGFVLIFPFTRKIILKNFAKKNKNREKNIIDGEFEEIDEKKNDWKL